MNVLTVGGKGFVLTAGSGSTVHITGEARPGDAGALFADGRATHDARWAETTLCGRLWAAAFKDWDKGPTCRRCLKLMDKLAPAPELADRFLHVVQVVTDTVLARGSAEILGVPYDRLSALCRHVGSAVRQQSGFAMETAAVPGRNYVAFICSPIADQHLSERMRIVELASDSYYGLGGQTHQRMPSSKVRYWAVWATG